MYTVLLADDEGSVLEVLKSSVSWQELGVETLLTAQDGLTALGFFKEDKEIDLAIVDIQMPRMNGLELIRRVRDISPRTHFIVLTAYGEFSYAQTAIRLGVENYLLKPFSKSEVEQTVRNALENIYQERQSTEFLLLENTLRRWTQGNISSEELSDRAAVLGINLYQAAYCVICIVKRGSASIALFRSVCLEALQELHYDTYGFWDEKNHYVIIIGGKAIDEQNLGKELSEAIRSKNAGHLAALAAGTPVGEADSLHLSYQTAMDAVELADPENTDVVLNISESRIGIDEDLLAEELRLIFFMQDRESRENGFRHLLMKLERGGWSPARGKSLARSCIRVLINEFPNVENIQEKIYGSLPSCGWPEYFPEAREAAEALLNEAQELFDSCFAMRSPAVQRTIRYIRNEVQEGRSVSLKEFCVKNGMNPSWLGHLFRTETGVFFNDYLTECRIERAVVLLRNPNRKIKDIAEEVGFNYSSYFVKCFRDSKGVSPMVWRDMKLGREEEPG